MAGRRSRSGRPVRGDARQDWFLGRLARAGTMRERLHIAWDWWRAEVRGDEDEVREVAEWLAARALALSRRRGKKAA